MKSFFPVSVTTWFSLQNSPTGQKATFTITIDNPKKKLLSFLSLCPSNDLLLPLDLYLDERQIKSFELNVSPRAVLTAKSFFWQETNKH